jgi:hypothetical protein
MIDLVRKYKVIIAIVFPILILVLIRSFGTDHFKNDAKKWAEPSVLRTNIINGKQIESLMGEKLIINLDKGKSGITGVKIIELQIPSDSIIFQNNISTIKKHKGPVLLYSKDNSVSVKVWMVLVQLGYKNIFILTNETDNEVLKYKFHPETSIKTDSLR